MKRVQNFLKKKNVAIFLIVVFLGLFILFVVQAIDGINKKMKTKVEIETSKGNIIIELYPQKAPVTVKNFLGYVNSGYYDGTVFHRVIKNFMIQGGGFYGNGTGKPTNPPIKIESDNGLKNVIGTIAMARTNNPNSATSQFFINVKDNNFLDYGSENAGYTVFGKIIKGMDVVQKIEDVNTTTRNGMQDWPVNNVVILKVVTI